MLQQTSFATKSSTSKFKIQLNCQPPNRSQSQVAANSQSKANQKDQLIVAKKIWDKKCAELHYYYYCYPVHPTVHFTGFLIIHPSIHPPPSSLFLFRNKVYLITHSLKFSKTLPPTKSISLMHAHSTYARCTD